MKRLAWLVVFAACGGKAPEPLEPPDPAVGAFVREPAQLVTTDEPELEGTLPRPELWVGQLVPDFHDELRWPLSGMTHPELEPRFNVATVFAVPGIGWQQLCERGVQYRHTGGRNVDESDYLRAWCQADRGEMVDACITLRRLLRSTVPGLRDAVRVDLATLIANDDDPDRLVAKADVRDVLTLDLIAAMSIELGRDANALTMNQLAMDLAADAPPDERCRRLAKAIVLGDVNEREQLRAAFTAKVPDPTCTALWNAVECKSSPGRSCSSYFIDQHIPLGNAEVLEASRVWPREPNWFAYRAVAEIALRAVELPEGRLLARTAVLAAVKTAPHCARDLLQFVREAQVYLADADIAKTLERCRTR